MTSHEIESKISQKRTERTASGNESDTATLVCLWLSMESAAKGRHTDMPRHDSLRGLLSAASLSSISCSDVTALPADSYPFRGRATQDSEQSCFCQMKQPFRSSVILKEQYWNVRLTIDIKCRHGGLLGPSENISFP